MISKLKWGPTEENWRNSDITNIKISIRLKLEIMIKLNFFSRKLEENCILTFELKTSDKSWKLFKFCLQDDLFVIGWGGGFKKCIEIVILKSQNIWKLSWWFSRVMHPRLNFSFVLNRWIPKNNLMNFYMKRWSHGMADQKSFRIRRRFLYF